MNNIGKISGLIFGLLILVGGGLYLKHQEKNYDSLISSALKKQREFPEFTDFYGEIEPTLPAASDNNKTVTGIDANHNGVRDDVDIWINRTAYNLNETKAMRQYAQAIQINFEICSGKSTQGKLSEAVTCLSALSDYQRTAFNFSRDTLDILLFNTEARKACKREVPQTLPEKADYYCNFEIQYPDNVVFGIKEWKKTLH